MPNSRAASAPTREDRKPTTLPQQESAPLTSSAATRRATTSSGDRRIVTVLFAEVLGFEAMQATLDPEDLTEIANALFKRLADVVYKFGGTIDKFLSDGLMALFGAPTAHEDDPERAVLAALAMRDRVRQSGAKSGARTGVRLFLRAGIHTGLVVAGEVGGEAKRDYTVMGDTVNLAQRMKASANPDQVLVTTETFRLTRRAFEFHALPPIQVKGRQEEVNPFELVGPREEEGTGGRERTNLVGRSEELSRLNQCLEMVTSGRPQLISIVGDAGIGKSRLVREFLHYILAYGAGVLFKGRGLSYQLESPFALLGTMLASYFGIATGSGAYGHCEELGSAAQTYWPDDWSRRAALLAHLVGIDTMHPEVSCLSPQQKRAASFLALNELLVAMSKRFNVLVSIEDLHWADEASLEWLTSLVDHLAAAAHEAASMMIICQYRPREDTRFVRFGGKIDLTKINLGPLGPPEARQLFGALVALPNDTESWSGDIRYLADAVQNRADGNPLFLSALVHSLMDQRILVEAGDGWVVAKQIADLHLPDTINRVVISRLDRLPQDLRRVLSAAAVMGRSFRSDVLASILGQDCTRAIESLCKLNLVHRRSNSEFAFDHSSTQEVAYQSLLQANRREFHREVGLAIEGLPGQDPSASAGMLARHFYLGGVPAKALHYLLVAARQARERFANREALISLRYALLLADNPLGKDLVDRLEVLKTLAEVETVMGDYPRALEHLQEAFPLAQSRIETAELLRLVGDVHERKGEIKAAHSRFKEAMNQLENQGAPIPLARLLLASSRLLLNQGDPQGAATLARDVLERLAAEISAMEVAQAHDLLGQAHFSQNQWYEALGEHSTALEQRERAQDVFGIAASKNALGRVHVVLGDWHLGASLFDESVKLYARCGDLLHLAEAQTQLGEIYAACGDIKTAERLQRGALEIFKRIGATFGEGQALVALGNTLAVGEHFEEALGLLREGMRIFEEIAATAQQADTFVAMARIALAAGLDEEGLGHIQRASKMAAATNNRLAEAVANRLKAELLAVDGSRDGANEAILRALRELEFLGAPLELGRAKLTQAKVERLLANEPRAIDLFREAVGIFSKLGAKPDLRLARDLAVGMSVREL